MNDNHTYHFPFASYPAIRLAFLLMGGILINDHFAFPSIFWLILFTFAGASFIIAEYHHSQSLKATSYTLSLAAYLLAVIAFGGAWHSLFNNQNLPLEAKLINTYVWEELSFSGTIYQLRSTATDKYQLDVAVDTTLLPGSLSWAATYNLHLLLDPDLPNIPDELKPGQRINFSATLYPLEEPRNPHEFNYKKYLASNNIYIRGGITSITDIKKTSNSWFSWNHIREKILNAIDTNFSKPSAPLAKALLIGYKNELDKEMKVSFSRTGLSHIMAVSGLHVGFLLLPFWFIIPYFWTFRYGKEVGFFILITLLFLYAGITGFSASVSRASIGGALLIYARLFHKVRDIKNLMAVAAIIILLINPSDLFAIGFQLSFAAVYIILLLMPVIHRGLPEWIYTRWYGKFLMAIIISLVVQAGLFPLLTYYFGEYSLIGPLTNAFVVPFLATVVPLALTLILVAPFFPGIAQILSIPADLFLSYLNWLVNWSAGWEWSWIQVQTSGPLLFGIWIIAILFMASLPIPKLRWKLLIILLVVVNLEQGNQLFNNLQPQKLQVTVFDVGQGDATLIKTPSGRHFLIDTGRWQPDYNSAKYVLIPFFKAENIKKLNGIFLSHPHADHIGGIIELMENVPIDTIYHSGSNYGSTLYKEYHLQARKKNIPLKKLSAGDQVDIGPSLRLFVYGPSSSTVLTSNVNNRSLILELMYGTTEFLFMGDAEAAQERRLTLNYGWLSNTDFLKVGHHGSKSSSTLDFILQSTPEIAVVSLGKTNRFQHPHREAIKRLRDSGAYVYFTSLQGCLIFESDGYSITRKGWRVNRR